MTTQPYSFFKLINVEFAFAKYVRLGRFMITLSTFYIHLYHYRKTTLHIFEFRITCL